MTVPATPQPKPQVSIEDRNNEYFKQLGMFVSLFPQTESYVFLFLVLTLGIGLEIGKAVFSGTRAKDAIGLIRRIFAVKQFLTDLLITAGPCFEQIFIINQIRNYLVHYKINFAGQISKPSMLSEHACRTEKWNTLSALRACLTGLISCALSVAKEASDVD